MTDEIQMKITRRIALEKYEFYEIEVTTNVGNLDFAFGLIEGRVDSIKNEMGEPSPEISPKKEPATSGLALTKPVSLPNWLADDLHQLSLNPDIVTWIEPNTIKLNTFLKDKEKWAQYNNVVKDAGFKWIADGKDSRWER